MLTNRFKIGQRVWAGGDSWLTIFTIYRVPPDHHVVWFLDGSQILLPVDFPLVIDDLNDPTPGAFHVRTVDGREWDKRHYRLIGSKRRQHDKIFSMPAKNGEYPVFVKVGTSEQTTYRFYLLEGGI